jgi:hypothetical protein
MVLFGKRNSIEIDEAQRIFSLLWEAFTELKDSDRTAETPLKCGRIKDGIGLWYQAIRSIVIGLRNTHSEVAVSHEPDQGSVLGTWDTDRGCTCNAPIKGLSFLVSELKCGMIDVHV